MLRSKHPPALLLILLVAVSLRMTFAAPYCMPQTMAAVEASVGNEHAGHADHGLGSDMASHEEHGGHEGHENHQQCCSACGPSLPPDLALLDARAAMRETPAVTPIRALATRPPYPAYDARGPPLLI